jgi:tetratricopeptide (TPR) repeat protein
MKNLKYILYILIIISLFSCGILSHKVNFQRPGFLRTQRWKYEKAELYFKNFQYEDALYYYKKIYHLPSERVGPNDFLITYNIAECYRNIGDTLCNAWYRETIKAGGRRYCVIDGSKERKIQAMEYIALSYFYLKDYKLADKWFDKIFKNLFFRPEQFCLIEMYSLNAYIISLKNVYEGDELKTKLDEIFDYFKAIPK